MEPCHTGGWGGRPLDAECLGCGHALFVHLRATEVCWVCEGMELARHEPVRAEDKVARARGIVAILAADNMDAEAKHAAKFGANAPGAEYFRGKAEAFNLVLRQLV